MAIFLTGATGYLGSYISSGLLREHSDRLALLVRAESVEAAEKRLWRSHQLHMSFEEFLPLLRSRVDIYLGDLTRPDLGLEPARRDELVKSMSSVIHCAASLNRKSAKACFNVNLRGTLEVIKMARDARDHHGLRRFSDISTVAVCGKRQDELVHADRMIDWKLSDYDPYARTKKFCEHMLHELLPDTQKLVFRPSIILGDSRFPETTQFDMVRAFVMLAQLPVLPFRPDWRVDIVPADYVGKAVVHIHQKDKPLHEQYNLSAGAGSLTYQQVVGALHAAGHGVRHRFVPGLERSFTRLVDVLAATPRKWGIALPASLMKVFIPYLVFNTVFDNAHVVEELGHEPARFDQYAYGLLRFAKSSGFAYPYRDWPGEAATRERKVA